MDPFAHTLVGATLAASGLRHTTRYATAALMIGANLPDIDVLATLWGEDVMLAHRRGWTHGVLAMVVLPLILACAFAAWHRWTEARNPTPAASASPGRPWRPGWLLGLCYLAVLSHPLLDWLNTYGVRLLMPFDDTWFYGDTLFIIDPWLWLLPLAATMLAWSANRRVLGLISGLAGFAALAVATTDLTPLFVKLAWLICLPAALIAAWWKPDPALGRTVALIVVLTLPVYIALSWALARDAEAAATLGASPTPLQVQANPVPGTPLAHRLVLVFADHYVVRTADGASHRVPRAEPGPVVRAALTSPAISGFRQWVRFPYWEVEAAADGWTVHFYDLRYQGPDEPAAGIGYARVWVPDAALPDLAPHRE